ncbi:CAP-associated domain-containing protein [Tetragenococcus halophilus]|nr:CAP-associated domain-containing protein [Tetragenococcus halophilus]
MASGFSFTINRYLIDDELLEVNSEDKVIKSIKYLGEEDDTIKPFKFGMTMDELSKIAMVYPNFTIDYQDETIDLELEEDDMNYRPLIAFDNGTFAILFFEQMQGESQLYAVDYLDSETLLKLAPYTVADDQGPRYAQEKGSDWEEIHQFKRQQTSDFLQLLRKRKEQPTFSLDSNLQMTSEKTLATFINDKEDILTTERLQELQRFEEEEPGTFMLNDSEMTDLLDDPSISGHFEMPVYDPSFSVLSWYSTPRLNERLLASNEASLAVAFSKENVLILWKELDYQTEESESN